MMHPRSSTRLKLMAFTAAAWMIPSLVVPCSQAWAQPAIAPTHLIPQSLRIAHKETLEQLVLLARKKGPVGIEANKALVVFKRHIAREEEFILPPLTLLPLLAEGKVTPEMAWALPMTDRVRAEREAIFEEHTKVTDALNALIVAATRANDKDAKEFAESAAADSLNDMEILEPTLLIIGDILHSKLPAGR
jgi:hypothetical protein